MRSSLANPCKPFRLICIALIAALTLLLSGWTCSAIFISCQGVVAQPQITSLSPDTVSSDAESVLTVEGSGFAPQSQIMWNGNALPTTFTDSRHVETTITPQTFEFFGGSPGGSVQISVRQGSGMGCPPGGNSATLLLVIN
jgi:hypothetical protein